MPELPEVTTTVSGINLLAKKLIIKDVWSDWPKLVKSPGFSDFKKNILGGKILGAERRGKNILIKLSGGKTLLIHMKMTGHIMYGTWRHRRAGDNPGWNWIPENGSKAETKFDANQPHVSERLTLVSAEPLNDPYNRFIHLIFFLSNGHQLVLADVRKFAKVILLNTDEINEHPDLKNLGPEPLEKNLTLKVFIERLNKKISWPVKQALMNQELIAGIGNIYSDEILWAAGVHPLRKVRDIGWKEIKNIYIAMRSILKKSIRLGGDSTSDYRNIHGERGGFQNVHMVYRRTGQRCLKKSCSGKIMRTKIGGRSAHFCSEHQISSALFSIIHNLRDRENYV